MFVWAIARAMHIRTGGPASPLFSNFRTERCCQIAVDQCLNDCPWIDFHSSQQTGEADACIEIYELGQLARTRKPDHMIPKKRFLSPTQTVLPAFVGEAKFISIGTSSCFPSYARHNHLSDTIAGMGFDKQQFIDYIQYLREGCCRSFMYWIAQAPKKQWSSTHCMYMLPAGEAVAIADCISWLGDCGIKVNCHPFSQ